MANTIIIYQGDGSTVDFAVPFDYLRKSFVKVYLDTVTELTGGASNDASSDYYFVDATTIRLRKIVPTSNQTLTIRRYTSVTDRVASFRDGSVLYAKDLDTSQVQAFHIAEEARDILNDALTINREGFWDAKNKRIVRVADPTDSQDAATKAYVDKVAGVQKDLEELERIIKGYRDETEEFRDESLKYATQAQASAGIAVSAQETVVVKSQDVTAKHEEVLSKAEQVRNDAVEVASNTLKVAQDAQQVATDRTVVEEASRIAQPIIDASEAITIVANNIEAVKTDATNINHIVIVGSDLEGTLQDALYDDYGTLGEETTPATTITGGNIKIVADNIDAIKSVVDKLDDISTVVSAQTVVKQYADEAKVSAGEAKSSASDALAYSSQSQTSASSASASADTARQSVEDAKEQVELASKEVTKAKDAVTSATSYSNLAKDWANKTDGIVADGEYSAKYYAQTAKNEADNAEADATSAGSYATEAQTYAENAKNSATSATQQATTATTQATSAKTSADSATIAKDEAERQAALAKQYAESASSGQVNSDWKETDETSKAFIKNKPTVPTHTSQLINNTGYLTSSAVYLKEKTYTKDEVDTKVTEVDTKVTDVDTRVTEVDARVTEVDTKVTTGLAGVITGTEVDSKIDAAVNKSYDDYGSLS